jgi:hypothetical protein
MSLLLKENRSQLDGVEGPMGTDTDVRAREREGEGEKGERGLVKYEVRF